MLREGRGAGPRHRRVLGRQRARSPRASALGGGRVSAHGPRPQRCGIACPAPAPCGAGAPAAVGAGAARLCVRGTALHRFVHRVALRGFACLARLRLRLAGRSSPGAASRRAGAARTRLEPAGGLPRPERGRSSRMRGGRAGWKPAGRCVGRPEGRRGAFVLLLPCSWMCLRPSCSSPARRSGGRCVLLKGKSFRVALRLSVVFSGFGSFLRRAVLCLRSWNGHLEADLFI